MFGYAGCEFEVEITLEVLLSVYGYERWVSTMFELVDQPLRVWCALQIIWSGDHLK